jgi:hypothetical protein
MFENRVVRRILGSKRDEETGEWRRLHREEYYYPCLSNVCFIKPRIKTRAVHVVVWEKGQVHTGIWWENLRERDHLE